MHVWQRNNLRDVPLSKRCIFAQRFYLAAISLKSTGSAAATVSVDFGRGRDRKSATTFFKPGKYDSCTLNSEMNAKWHCCRGELGTETRDKAVTSGLRLVQSWNAVPSQKWWKCSIAA